MLSYSLSNNRLKLFLASLFATFVFGGLLALFNPQKASAAVGCVPYPGAAYFNATIIVRIVEPDGRVWVSDDFNFDVGAFDPMAGTRYAIPDNELNSAVNLFYGSRTRNIQAKKGGLGMEQCNVFGTNISRYVFGDGDPNDPIPNAMLACWWKPAGWRGSPRAHGLGFVFHITSINDIGGRPGYWDASSSEGFNFANTSGYDHLNDMSDDMIFTYHVTQPTTSGPAEPDLNIIDTPCDGVIVSSNAPEMYIYYQTPWSFYTGWNYPYGALSVPSGRTMAYAAIVNRGPDQKVRWVDHAWNRSPGCTRNFIVTPLPSKPTFIGPEDNPSGASFSGGNVSSDVAINKVNITCDYTLVRSNPSSPTRLASDSIKIGINGSVGVCAKSIGGFSVAPGDQLCLTISADPGSGTVDYDGNVRSNNGSVTSTATCETIKAKPYIGAFGGDVRAGGVFGNTCTLATAAKIDTYNGSGSQLAAIASGTIDTNAGFKTFRMNTPGNTLAFANTPSSGNFSNSHCIHDYFNDKPADLVGNLPSSLNGLADGITYVNGDQTINGNTNSFDKHSKVYINGNLTINKNIAFANGPWGSRASIPGLQVIVSGNIYISKDVTQLDGVYVSKGTVYTRSEGVDRANGNAILTNRLYDNCNNQLVVNGALIAKDVKLLRAFGSNYMAGNSEHPTSSKSCAAGRQGFTCAGEVFNFTPETYLAQWPATSGGGNNNGAQYDSITNLPPIL